MICKEFEISGGGKLTAYVQDSQIYYQVYKKKPAMIICPGGAYMIHATRESEPAAVEFMAKGFQCFVLYYSVGTDREHPEKGINYGAKYPVQVLQIMEAMHLIHEHAEEWQVDTENIFVTGFSAGAHVCASLGTRWNDPELMEKLSFIPKPEELKPAGMVLAYPMLCLNDDAFIAQYPESTMAEQTSTVYEILFHDRTPSDAQKESVNLLQYVSEDTVPAFIWNCIDDLVIDCRNAMRFVENCLEKGVACEYHLFDHGGHGLAGNNELTVMDRSEIDPAVSQWTELAVAWIRGRKNERS